jgi:EF-P beta-lysylation protein EpmB
MPVHEELNETDGFGEDPVGDRTAARELGLLHKYAGRVLLVVTGVCAVHCRYCFRRHFPYHELPHGDRAWDRALAAIAGDDSIGEVILSGGDPLMWVDRRLAALVRRILAIDHVQRLRVHTRLPVMIPNRVTESLIAWLAGGRLAPVMVLHVNHARELSEDVAEAIGRLQRAGVMLLNQAVLLRRVNDSVSAQISLSERLVQLGVVPYYLHQLDRVRGAAHFEVPIEQGQKIIAALRRQLPGYAVPRYVREVAGEPYKMPLE